MAKNPRIVPRSLAANAYVSGEMYEEDDDEGAIYFSFEAYNRQGDVELTKLALLYNTLGYCGRSE